jgi:class 3 adenylate cyclase
LFIVKNLSYFDKKRKKPLLLLILICTTYVTNIILNENITLFDFELNRDIMLLFTSPILLKLYSEITDVSFNNLQIHYHIIHMIINILIIPIKYTSLFYGLLSLAYCSECYFLYNLYKNKNPITDIYILILSIFMIINIAEVFSLFDIYSIEMYYLYANTIEKLIIYGIVHDNNNRYEFIKDNLDLQCINYISNVLKNIDTYIDNNSNITEVCKKYIDYTKTKFLEKIPSNTDLLKNELLQKILPFGLDNDAIFDKNKIIENKMISPNIKRFEFICILFIDIVNYTELAKRYDDTIIFDLLNRIYNLFDNIIKKYPHLQKIETIGDAYMVVGDIYRTNNNHKIVIKEIILLALEYLKEMKNITTKNNEDIKIRIGINLGSVSIGILGNTIPRLCVVGNAVNVASRLQSTADPNTIQLSRHIYEKLEEIYFEDLKLTFVEKENVFLKNIGSVNTYNIIPKS